MGVRGVGVGRRVVVGVSFHEEHTCRKTKLWAGELSDVQGIDGKLGQFQGRICGVCFVACVCGWCHGLGSFIFAGTLSVGSI